LKIPIKKAFNRQRLLNDQLRYDYVGQLFVNSQGDTIKEATSRIWQKKQWELKIVTMNNLLNKISD
jgi:hypothetical protein